MGIVYYQFNPGAPITELNAMGDAVIKTGTLTYFFDAGIGAFYNITFEVANALTLKK